MASMLSDWQRLADEYRQHAERSEAEKVAVMSENEVLKKANESLLRKLESIPTPAAQRD
jgi:hypothetical protein